MRALHSILSAMLVFFVAFCPLTIVCHKGNPNCSCNSCATKSEAKFTQRPSKTMQPKTRKIKRSRKPKKTKIQKTKATKKTKKQKWLEGSKTASQLDYDELKVVKNKLLAKKNKWMAIKYIERMVPLCKDLGELAGLMLELADLLFDTEHIAKAEKLYNEFAKLYPGDEKVEYASYRAIVCSYWNPSEYYRDQSKTKETIELAQTFLKRKEVFTTYADKVQEILTACQELLLQSEINIFSFYLNRGDFLGAHTRLANIEKEFIPLLPHHEPEFIMLACDLAQKQNNLELLAHKQADLAARFPEFNEQPVVVASGKKQTNFLEKF